MNRPKAKGSRFAQEVCDYLAETFPGCERRVERGIHDAGDVAGLKAAGDWCLQLKATKKIDLAGTATATEKQRRAAGARWCAAVFKRRMKGTADAYVVMSLAQFRALLVELDGPRC